LELEPGTIIARKYRAHERLGAGAMGEVWSGEQLSDGQPVALKLLLPAAALNNEVVARFRREAQVLERVQSPYVAGVLDFLSDPTFGLMLVMQLIQGESMLAMLRRAGRISIESALELGADITRGLHDLHESRIVHRDLKPGNIVLRPNPGRIPTAILIDFGMSRILSGPDEDDEVTAITRGDRVLGTLEYIAPEQILVARSVTGAADLYALGCILFRAIAGFHVFGDAVEARLVAAKLNTEPPALPVERTDPIAVRTQALVNRLLSRRLRDRYQQAQEVLQEIGAILALSHRDGASAHDEEEEEMATLCLPAPALALATAQAMLGTVQGYQIEATPGPGPPPQPRVVIAAAAPQPAWTPASAAASGAANTVSAAMVARQRAAHKPRSEVRLFAISIGIAMICGAGVGWLVFWQIQTRGWFSGVSPASSTPGVIAPDRAR
jgi:serine/threonine-protein kinase